MNTMKLLRITSCADPQRWYADKIGKLVPFLEDVGNEYKSREPSGFVNFVQHQDAHIEDVADPAVGHYLEWPVMVGGNIRS